MRVLFRCFLELDLCFDVVDGALEEVEALVELDELVELDKLVELVVELGVELDAVGSVTTRGAVDPVDGVEGNEVLRDEK